jgi:hypothetical protein
MNELTDSAQTSRLARASRFLGVFALFLLLLGGGLLVAQVLSARAHVSDLQGPSRAKRIESFLYEVIFQGVALVAALTAFVLGIIALVEIRRSAGQVKGTGHAVSGLVTATLVMLTLGVAYGVVLPILASKARKLESANNLTQLGLAMQMYYETYGSFPPAVLRDRGQPYSWRVALLRFLGPEEEKLFWQYRRDEPWDSPANKAVLAHMPRVFALPGGVRHADGLTHYQVLVGAGTAFERPEEGVHIGSFPRGTEHTILVVEAADPVPWTKPEDLPYAPDGPLPKVGGIVGDGFHAMFANGDVRWIEAAEEDNTLRTLVPLLSR